MNKLIKLSTNSFFRAAVGDRGLRVYKREVDGRLGMPGLSALVIKVTGHKPRHDEAYCFVVRNQNRVKILITNQDSTSMLEVFDQQAQGIKEEFVELGLL
ncbi:hypothetical protein HDC92_004564 [Pedobacter sp. AK017]|uniref:IS66 family insertion sequence element accessory protein TnpB n=1 Tax=Pedobacter sp. AK017 TaxID=2723073 RepID=UPI00160725D3|nr:IS66 family insertion sequence element accessory protein TnpB [Pedobacter sp. AK017]MBB5440860.1 hypothetical protein [Pedobacter sp. AK017]